MTGRHAKRQRGKVAKMTRRQHGKEANKASLNKEARRHAKKQRGK